MYLEIYHIVRKLGLLHVSMLLLLNLCSYERIGLEWFLTYQNEVSKIIIFECCPKDCQWLILTCLLRRLHNYWRSRWLYMHFKRHTHLHLNLQKKNCLPSTLGIVVRFYVALVELLQFLCWIKTGTKCFRCHETLWFNCCFLYYLRQIIKIILGSLNFALARGARDDFAF